MIILFFLFWGAVLFVLAWLVLLAMYITGLVKKDMELTRIGGGLAVASVLLVAAGSLVYTCFLKPNPENVYSSSFGVEPHPDVRDLQGHSSYWTDTALAYMKFKASPSTIKKLVGKGWKRIELLESEDGKASGFHHASDEYASSWEVPSWYSPSVTKTSVAYEAEGRIGSFASAREKLIYDAATQEAYYEFVGID